MWRNYIPLLRCTLVLPVINISNLRTLNFSSYPARCDIRSQVTPRKTLKPYQTGEVLNALYCNYFQHLSLPLGDN